MHATVVVLSHPGASDYYYYYYYYYYYFACIARPPNPTTALENRHEYN